jgi:sigma-B regulation protein RsbU (phosphoserine phosphatase)
VQQTAQHLPNPDVIQHVMVVDDSRLQRRILSSMLTRWGFRVTEAEDAYQALDLCQKDLPDLVFSDWMMPGLTGLEFCQKFRQLCPDHYSYFILLTSKSEKNDIARGLDAGADDFLAKPVNAHELRARISAGERILSMERELQSRNAMITDTLSELQKLYHAIDNDLVEAKKLQHSLIREPNVTIGNFKITQFLQSAGHVGGDLVGIFPAGDKHLGLFGIDVSGHGISSALFTARLAGYLSSGSAEHNIALGVDDHGVLAPLPTSDVLAMLNTRVLDEMETDLYFTMSLATLDLTTGQIALSQAGHPHPIIQHGDGAFSLCGSTGVPIGLLDDTSYDTVKFILTSGDRLFIASDGITECPDPDGNLLEETGFQKILARHLDKTGRMLIDAIMDDLSDYSGGADFPDDISILMIECL